jgi:hypothetical protein
LAFLLIVYTVETHVALCDELMISQQDWAVLTATEQGAILERLKSGALDRDDDVHYVGPPIPRVETDEDFNDRQKQAMEGPICRVLVMTKKKVRMQRCDAEQSPPDCKQGVEADIGTRLRFCAQLDGK